MTLTKEMARQSGYKVKECRGQVAGKPKGFRDFVTEADLASESIILESINSHFPDHNILSEESGEKESLVSDYCWLIDPIDGTKNYLWGITFACVSIALAFKGVVHLGVVYDPWRDEMFWGRTGTGVYLNDQRVQVAEHNHLNESIVSTDFGTASERVELTAGLAKSLQGEVSGLRSFGSAALSMAYIACGRLDAYFNYGLAAWDMAAGGFLVREAGGITSDLTGGAEYLNTHSCLSDNGLIHDQILTRWRADAIYDLLPAPAQEVK